MNAGLRGSCEFLPRASVDSGSATVFLSIFPCLCPPWARLCQSFFFFSYLKGSFLFFFLHHFLHSQMLAQSRSKAFNSLLYKENWNWKCVARLALSVRKDTSKKRLKVSKHESVCTNILMPEYALLRCQPLPTFSVGVTFLWFQLSAYQLTHLHNLLPSCS